MLQDLKFLHIILLLLLGATNVIAQEQEFSLIPISGLEGRIETQFSFSEGTTPLWLNANKYGMSSLESNNAHIRMKAERKIDNDSARQWGIGYAADVAMANHLASHLIIQQLFAKIRYRKASVTFGQKEETLNLKPHDLSTGSQTLGINARPIPGIRIALDDYVDFLHGWMGIKGHFFYGMQTDGSFQKKHETEQYTDHILVHHKAGFLRFGKKDQPLTIEAGLEMATQFGGTTYKSDGTVENNDKSLLAFVKAIYGGTSDVESGNYHSSLGNMLGSILLRVNYDRPSFAVSAYADHLFEDNSQLVLIDYDGYGEGEEWEKKKRQRYLLYPLKDLLAGVECRIKNFNPLNRIVIEYICTRNQSGPIYHDHTPVIPDHIGGMDNYMNHGIYGSWSHWGQINGNPLYRAPLYDGHALKTTNNRFKAWHFGIAGNPTDELSYRLLATWQKGWGTYDNPFTYMQRNFSMLAEAEYNLNSIVKGITVKGAFALDRGSILGDNTGAQLSIIWNGKLCR